VTKIRLTGGEPLLRRDLERLIGMLAEMRTVEGLPLDLTLTTNGSVLARKAEALKAAGLARVTISLDALDDAIFRRMNDAEIVPMARHFRGRRIALRFIEYMDVGSSNGWRMDEVLPSAEVIARIAAVFPVRRLGATAPGETAERWAYADAGVAGEVGTISSVTKAFCGDCNRARLSTEGKLFLCLFASRGHDLRALLRGGMSDAEISAAIGLVWQGRADRYSELRSSLAAPSADAERRVEMHYIGG